MSPGQTNFSWSHLYGRACRKVKQIAHRACRVVIITFGLIEIWRDILANTFLNSTPPLGVLQRYPDRYEFHVTDFFRRSSELGSRSRTADTIWPSGRAVRGQRFRPCH